MTIRVLDNADAITGSDLAAAWPILPKGGKVIVCEQDGQILGHLALVPLLHVEGIAIQPSVQGFARGVVLNRLLEAMHAEARALGQHTVFPAAADPHMVALLDKLHAREIPARWFALTVKES